VTPLVEELTRRALVMRRVRAVMGILIPLEMLLYVPPRSIPGALDPVRSAAFVVASLLLLTVSSAAVHRRAKDAPTLIRWARVELATDAAIVLAVLQTFAFDQFSSIWTVLVIVVLEGAFREGLGGALVVWAATGTAFVGIQVAAASAYPATAPLDAGAIVFRAVVTGLVAVVAGSLASQLQAAVGRHRASEIALAEQCADLRLIGRVSRAIAAGPEARGEVCRAVAELTGADLVMLYEPVGNLLRGTAAAGCPADALPALRLDDETSGTVRAYRTALLTLVAEADPPQAFTTSPHLVKAADAASAVFVPVLRDQRPIGALALTFDSRIEQLPTRVAVALEVLAEEAAVAITRADAALQLAEQARRDPLTGLANRRGWEEALDIELDRSARTGAPVSVLMLDLDGLKSFNDTYGHQAGDRLLSATAQAWLGRLRPTDVLARYGGDEFVAVLPGCTASTALRVADALLAALPPGGGCSAGVACWDGSEDAAMLQTRADTALYAVKRAGGGRAAEAEPDAAPQPRREATRCETDRDTRPKDRRS
jgi:diguanylate cyclase (GGDEF)-like protein